MSEFIEIGGDEESGIFRVSDISAVTQEDSGVRLITTIMGEEYETDEPYESIRDKLLGKTSPDLRGKFADQLVAYFRGKGQHVLASEIAAFYNSMMLSETEGAG